MLKRVDALLSQLGYCTRKDSRRFLRKNSLTIGDEEIRNPALKVKHADLKLNGEDLDPLKIVVLMNKPPRTICSHDDAGALIYGLLPQRWQYRNPKVSTVGRLDADTTGAIILTDDGALNHKLTSPRSNIPKVYEAVLAQELNGNEKEIFASGTLILKGEDKPCLPAVLEVIDDTKVRLEIVEGKYHQVKRMFAAVGNKVIKLHRVSFGEFDVKDLEEGEYKFINLD
ncbi:pseudouridine synthase [Malaciobacter pacificus]|jgi:16S rRNA pseudouridine516 synthase|uniref:Pseudouridine synthase n=1 Tax=Malaciobacter pacificus TaxID=1080223 RepID=A0A5C2H8Q3_9BACT|nr:16S rRNA pseudouridine(516) synthase [Malaciobacter pacificus]QEP34598.1 RsuA-like pseudouridine synthase [Malaciobacter pacificus]GGD37501.1 pseudouridine synthase [Malaciobacter pacificus]